MEGNLCWNCQYIVTCEPAVRPCRVRECVTYIPLENPLTQKQIAAFLGTTIDIVKKTVVREDPAKIVEQMKAKGISVRFIRNNTSVKFYKVSTNA